MESALRLLRWAFMSVAVMRVAGTAIVAMTVRSSISVNPHGLAAFFAETFNLFRCLHRNVDDAIPSDRQPEPPVDVAVRALEQQAVTHAGATGTDFGVVGGIGRVEQLNIGGL